MPSLSPWKQKEKKITDETPIIVDGTNNATERKGTFVDSQTTPQSPTCSPMLCRLVPIVISPNFYRLSYVVQSATMLRNTAKQSGVSGSSAADQSSPGSVGSAGSSGPSSPGYETARPRKKLSFKEPEIFSYYMKMKKPSSCLKTPPIHPVPPILDVTFDENPFEEENVDLDELESQAMRVVRTVGQAFEVCHKLSLNAPSDERGGERDRDRERGDNIHHDEDYEDQDETTSEQPQPSPLSVHKDISLMGDGDDPIPEQTSVPCLLRSHDVPATMASASPVRHSPSGTVASECGGLLVGGELTALKHEIQLLRERLEQQGQQTRAAVAHARLLQDQLAAETAARVEAQARTHQLLVQNKELLEHIGALVGHLREQERLTGSHTAMQSQVPSGATVSQAPTVPDLSNLGQHSQRTGGPNSPWELDPPPFAYYPYSSEALYSGNPGVVGVKGASGSTDQLNFQVQLLERLHNISPYQPQRSPYTTPSPYPIGSNLLLPPSNVPINSVQLSPNSVSLRVSQANSYSSSPVMTHKAESYTPGAEATEDQSAFIRPLPCGSQQRSPVYTDLDGKKQRPNFLDDPPPPIVLDPPPPGKRSDPKVGGTRNPSTERANAEKSVQTQKNLVNILRTPGPPPSRTTSARLPSRSDLMNQVQRTMWARHTTK